MSEFLYFPELGDDNWIEIKNQKDDIPYEDYILILHSEIQNTPNDAALGAKIRKRYIESQKENKENPSM
jgi:hypothetical protein